MSDKLSRVGSQQCTVAKGLGAVCTARARRPHTHPPCGMRGTRTASSPRRRPLWQIPSFERTPSATVKTVERMVSPGPFIVARLIPLLSFAASCQKHAPLSLSPRLSRATRKWQYNEGVKMKLLGDSDEVGGREAQPACGFACCGVASVHCFCSLARLARRCRRRDVFGSVSSASQTTFPQFWAWAGC
jgi:hypothetical protein